VRVQLREFHTPERLAEIYAKPYDHTRWEDHKIRVARTIEIATEFGDGYWWQDGIDLSCGDGAILDELRSNLTVQKAYFGDMVQMAGPPWLDVIGPIETTLPAHIRERGRYNLFVCSETLEHVQDPDELLRGARRLADHMVLSTPIAETHAHGNEEHYWSWEVSDVEEMLHNAGWLECDVTILPLGFYDFQIWICS
jgi:hypothetical protein